MTIPALVHATDDSVTLEHALVENLHRDDLNALEEAAAYQQLIEDFGLTHDEVATQVGRSRATVSNMLRLLQLPPSIQRALQERKLTMGHARALLGTPDRAFQEQLAKRAIDDDLSVRSVEEAIREHETGDTDATPDPEKGEASGTVINQNLRAVSNPPGAAVYSFADGAKLLAEGKKVNYEGASGSCDFDQIGDILSAPFMVQQVRNGKSERVLIVNP